MKKTALIIMLVLASSAASAQSRTATPSIGGSSLNPSQPQEVLRFR